MTRFDWHNPIWRQDEFPLEQVPLKLNLRITPKWLAFFSRLIAQAIGFWYNYPESGFSNMCEKKSSCGVRKNSYLGWFGAIPGNPLPEVCWRFELWTMFSFGLTSWSRFLRSYTMRAAEFIVISRCLLYKRGPYKLTDKARDFHGHWKSIPYFLGTWKNP